MTSLHPPSLSISIAAALRDSESKNDRARAGAAHALGSVEDPEHAGEVMDALFRLLGDVRSPIRATAALSLAEVVLAMDHEDSDAATIDALAAGLDDSAADARQACAVALGRLGDPAGFAPLAEKLAEGPPDLRFQAATSLVEIDAARAYDALTAQLADETDGEVLGALCLGLGEIGDRRAVPHMVPVLENERTETRFDAAYALSQLGDQRALGVLAGFLHHPSLAWDAICALEDAGAASAAAPLAEILARRFAPRVLKLRAAAAILAIAPDSDHAATAREVLIAGTSAWRHQHRALAVQLLGQLDGDWAREALLSLRGRRTGRTLSAEIDTALAHHEPQ
ncbi:MAG TPA: HEAT repeat domain-containing protein [Kofleriaceae bacterium]|nr:HEAT repeat domain-containing protein [Kofleriaceae bacterium]